MIAENLSEPNGIPRELEELYEGQWLAWDTVAHELVGYGATMDEAMQASDEAFATGHLIYYHHVLPRDAIVVGGL
jgi:hypothetical protein